MNLHKNRINILYIGYWSALDGLSESTIKPHINILNSFDEVKSIFYSSIEREKIEVKCNWDIAKMIHIPFYSPPKSFLRDKIDDFTKIPSKLILLCNKNKIDKIICRSALAGAIGYLIWKKTKIPYYVESFEPHGAYMLESKVWTKYDLRYWIQQYFETKQKKTASALMPVSNNYTAFLKQDTSIKCAIETIPCSVDTEKFSFSLQERNTIRKKLNIAPNAIVGIYVGKFGDIYYNKEAFDFFKMCLNYLDNFFLLILTPQHLDKIKTKLKNVEYPLNKCWVGNVNHNEVTNYLSASDVAFSLHKTTKWSMAFSPIKNGEYWANGLPILINENIGDDSTVISTQGGGIIINYNHTLILEQINNIKDLIIKSNTNRLNNQSVTNAKTYRNECITQAVYKKTL